MDQEDELQPEPRAELQPELQTEAEAPIYVEPLPSPGPCRKCGSLSTVFVGSGNVCNACGYQWAVAVSAGGAE
jgi:hypothetical protein